MKETKINELQETEVLQEEQPKVHKKQSKHGMKALIALTLAFALLIGSSFAYFSDYATSQTTGTAGTLAIALESDINLLDAEGRDILNPGDIRSGSFTVTNMGNKSADIRTTIALTAYDRDGNPIDLEGSNTTQSIYDLYLASDVEFIDGQGNIPKQGVQPLQTKNVNGNVITYSIPEYSLNGNSDLYDEVEKISNQYSIAPLSANMWGVEGTVTVIPGEGQPPVAITPDYSHSNDFVLVFNTQAGNEWQGSVVRIDIIVEAKQHENTSAGWQLVEHQDLVVGSLSQSVVVPENVITTNGTINPGYEYTPGSGSGEGSSSNAYSSVRGTLRITESGDAIPIKVYTQDMSTCVATVDSEWTYKETIDYGKYTVDVGEWAFEFTNLQPNTNYVLWFDEDGDFDATYTFTTSDAGTITVLTLNLI